MNGALSAVACAMADCPTTAARDSKSACRDMTLTRISRTIARIVVASACSDSPLMIEADHAQHALTLDQVGTGP